MLVQSVMVRDSVRFVGKHQKRHILYGKLTFSKIFTVGEGSVGLATYFHQLLGWGRSAGSSKTLVSGSDALIYPEIGFSCHIFAVSILVIICSIFLVQI